MYRYSILVDIPAPVDTVKKMDTVVPLYNILK